MTALVTPLAAFGTIAWILVVVVIVLLVLAYARRGPRL